jgi:membrane protease YdiL (CAAX protease family)
MLVYYLMLFQMALLPFLVMTVVYCFRNHIDGDPRKYRAALVGMAVGSAGFASLLLKTVAAPDAYAPLKLTFSMLPVLGAGALIGLSCYAGMLLGVKQGGYWVKPNTRMLPAVLACLAGAGASLLFTVVLLRALGLQISASIFPSSLAGWGGFLFEKTAHSFGEEVFFRGWCLAYLSGWGGRFRFNPWSANLIIAAVFAVQHTNGLQQVLLAFWGGLIFGKIFQRYGLIPAACTHLLVNLLTPLFPYVT